MNLDLPPLAQAYIQESLQALHEGDIARAAGLAEELRGEHPHHIRVWRLLNDVYLAAGRAAEAIAFFRSHLTAPPTRETMEHYTLLARAARYAGDPASALEILEQVLRVEPNLLEARFEYGLAKQPLLPVRQDCKWKNISVCLPSRFTQHPGAGWYWLERAVDSIRQQTIAKKLPIQICVGIDHGADIPAVFQNQADVIFNPVAADAPKNQAAAVNAAAAAATGDIIAFLEDDDLYFPQRLENALMLLQKYDFVGGTQQAITPNQVPFQIHDYANPTTWVMRHEFWRRVGPMDTTYRFHLDAEWLGRLNASGGLRVHEIESNAPREWHRLATSRQFYMYFYSVIQPGSGVYYTDYAHPLAAKTVHDNSMSDIAEKNPEYKKQSDAEHMRMETKYHGRPF